jgi:hypothetical protein
MEQPEATSQSAETNRAPISFLITALLSMFLQIEFQGLKVQSVFNFRCIT